MSLERLALILVIVISAAAATVWIGSLIFATYTLPAWVQITAAIPMLLIGYVVYRTIAERLGNAEDDHYDGMDN